MMLNKKNQFKKKKPNNMITVHVNLLNTWPKLFDQNSSLFRLIYQIHKFIIRLE